MKTTVEFEAKTKRQKVFKAYWYVKVIYGRGNSYLSIPLGVAGSYMMFSMWLKIYFGITSQVFIGAIAVLVLGIVFLGGYVDIKKGIMNEETSFGNGFNPEIQFIREKLKK